eukprot:TRINITY_DN6476_c0_g1_i3.p1 TRINITY_DN6476_c0_g1~~TRINITY_DN6476_c0_g1_i3.p1  ORF type:complete len:259 (-),score=20.87 TRINITY_DN6476_c0_g1_i3:96-848(-)
MRTNLHTSYHYIKTWKEWEAAREYFQNWRDGSYHFIKRTLIIDIPHDLQIVLDPEVLMDAVRRTFADDPQLSVNKDDIRHILYRLQPGLCHRLYILTNLPPIENNAPTRVDIMTHASRDIRFNCGGREFITKLKKYEGVRSTSISPAIWEGDRYVKTTTTEQNPATTFIMEAKFGESMDVLSSIRYDVANNTLIFENPGYLSSRCFILGGSDALKHTVVDADTSGFFGEGMKLASLAALRSGSEIKISSR